MAAKCLQTVICQKIYDLIRASLVLMGVANTGPCRKDLVDYWIRGRNAGKHRIIVFRYPRRCVSFSLDHKTERKKRAGVGRGEGEK